MILVRSEIKILKQLKIQKVYWLFLLPFLGWGEEQSFVWGSVQNMGIELGFALLCVSVHSLPVILQGHRRTDAFKLWCWRILLRVHWIARRSNHSILKEINPEYSLEGLELKLKLPHFGHRTQRMTHQKRP